MSPRTSIRIWMTSSSGRPSVPADHLPQPGQLVDRPVDVPIEIVLPELVPRRETRAHAGNVEIGVEAHHFVMDALISAISCSIVGWLRGHVELLKC